MMKIIETGDFLFRELNAGRQSEGLNPKSQTKKGEGKECCANNQFPIDMGIKTYIIADAPELE